MNKPFVASGADMRSLGGDIILGVVAALVVLLGCLFILAPKQPTMDPTLVSHTLGVPPKAPLPGLGTTSVTTDPQWAGILY